MKNGRTAGRVRSWLFDTALPLWAERGVDASGLFHEKLDFRGRPDLGSTRRMRVQARQLYVFAEAALMGWEPGRAIAERGMDRFVETCWQADGKPGFVHLLTPEGGVANPLRDLYDHAFGLFALAAMHRLNGDPRARRMADDLLAFLDRDWAHEAGGYEEVLPGGALPRRANPHMHLLEALLAWHGASGDPAYLGRANVLIDLLKRIFFDPATGTLTEFFDAGWQRASGADGAVVEPGHHCEWAWLLVRAAERGALDATTEARTLYRFALQNGLDAAGFAIDECNPQGRQTRASRRSWPQTELIKAHIAMAGLGEAGAARGAARVTDALFETYLATDVPGLWMDQYDETGKGITANVPASTFYHLMVAFREVLERG